MQRKLIVLATMAVATLVSTQVRAERTFYNHAERNRARQETDQRVETRGAEALEVERVRNFYIVPMVGAEVATIGARLYTTGDNNLVRERNEVGFAPAFGINAGWRLGYLNLGLRYQGSVFSDPDFRTLSLNKFYGEVGFNARHRALLFNAFVAGGYAFASSADQFANGVGGKVGVAFDILVTRAFSIGPAFSFDVHAYRPSDPWIVAYGGTAQLRLGFHI